MEILPLKVTLLIILCMTCLAFGLLPVKLAKFVMGTTSGTSYIQQRAKQCMSLLSCFGGGVFLATCLLDLLPTVRDNLSLVFDRLQIYTAYPITEFVIAFGFFVIVIVEQIALDCKEKSSQKAAAKQMVYPPISGDHEANQSLMFNSGNEGRHHVRGAGDYGSINNECNSGLSQSNEFRASQTPNSITGEPDNHDIHSHSALRSLLLLLALSLHSVFEGLAMGLQTDDDQLLAIFTAVIIHKNILAFSLGMNLVQSRLSKGSIVISCIVFAAMAPIGIILGIVLIESFSDFTHSVMNGLLQGFATGTFLYITFFEVLPHEMQSNKDRLLKVLFLLLGFGTIAGLLFLDPTVVRPSCYQGAQPV